MPNLTIKPYRREVSQDGSVFMVYGKPIWSSYTAGLKGIERALEVMDGMVEDVALFVDGKPECLHGYYGGKYERETVK